MIVSRNWGLIRSGGGNISSVVVALIRFNRIAEDAQSHRNDPPLAQAFIKA
jgi:hypothetical protein